MNKKYDSTIARIAGNLLSGNPYLFLNNGVTYDEDLAINAVRVARLIIAEVERTEPKADENV